MCESIQVCEHLAELLAKSVKNNSWLCNTWAVISWRGGVGQLWKAITRLVYVRFKKIKNWQKATVKPYIFATGNFRESADFRENREIFMHAKISCFTVSSVWIWNFVHVIAPRNARSSRAWGKGSAICSYTTISARQLLFVSLSDDCQTNVRRLPYHGICPTKHPLALLRT